MNSGSSVHTPREFFEKLTRNDLGPPTTLTGIIQQVEGDEDHADFAFGVRCAEWRRIPLASIASIEFVRFVSCDNHNHPFVRLSFSKPESEEARLFAALMNDVRREAERVVATMSKAPSSGSTVEMEANPGDCNDCIRFCGQHGMEHFWECIAFCMQTYC